MKKSLFALMVLFGLFFLVACGEGAVEEEGTATETESAIDTGDVADEDTTDDSQEAVSETVTVIDFDGQPVEVKTNPTVVAVYDFGVLDILYNIGFERTGIETLIIPSSAGRIPESLSYFDGAEFVHNGGTLFYVDHDVLDLIQPELVILGSRSFGMNAAGDRLGDDDRNAFRDETFERYEDTTWLRLGPGREINLIRDMTVSADALSLIFPELADDIQAELASILEGIEEVYQLASASDSTAAFVMMMDATSISVFNPGSRFNMLYEEFGFTAADQDDTLEFTDQHGYDVRAEYLLSVNPDVIFVLDRSNNMIGPGPAFDNILEDPIIAQTTAAQNGNIIPLDPSSWYTITGGFGAARQMIDDVMVYLTQ